eukprot:365149-Chlamydomonas_euryale.AAC.7
MHARWQRPAGYAHHALRMTQARPHLTMACRHAAAATHGTHAWSRSRSSTSAAPAPTVPPHLTCAMRCSLPSLPCGASARDCHTATRPAAAAASSGAPCRSLPLGDASGRRCGAPRASLVARAAATTAASSAGVAAAGGPGS